MALTSEVSIKTPSRFSPDPMEDEALEDAIAITEKKVAMSLDDLIKMSKKAASKGKRRRRRLANKGHGFPNGNAPQGNGRVHSYIDSRRNIRQGVLAQRRSNFRDNQFPVTTEVASKAVKMPTWNRVGNWNRGRAVATTVQRKVSADGSSDGKQEKVVAEQRPRTLDALFASMKEQRMRAFQQKQHRGGRQTSLKRHGRRQQSNAPNGIVQGLGKYIG